jgi:OmpA-OmpF porin, OOP family
MKKFFLILTICSGLQIMFNSTNGNAQNLVPNPSFEQYDTCPDLLNQIQYAIGWNNFGNTPDYYNACSQIMNVPNTQGGYQLAYDGNAYCGVYTFAYGGVNYREYWCPFN